MNTIDHMCAKSQMLWHHWKFYILLSALLLLGLRLEAQDQLPRWFPFDAERPYAIFDAWKELSRREATICLGETWQTLAGQLQNELGEPIPNAPLHISHYTGIRGYSVRIQTDDNGHFIVYSPFVLDIEEDDENSFRRSLRHSSFYCTPGYPNTAAGQAYAAQRKAGHKCTPKPLSQDRDRAFYILTCKGDFHFDPDEFRDFEREFLSRKAEPRAPWRHRPHDPEGRPEERTIRRYDVRVVDQNDHPIADAIVKYQFAGIEPGCWQVRQTNAEGRCEIEEWLLPRQLAGDFRADDYIMRRTTVDAPGFAVGPVTLDLQPDKLNTIRLSPPAIVEGKVLDHLGSPHACRLWLRYKKPAYVAFEGHFPTRADGTFRFERIMPDEEFAIETDGFDFRWHQSPSVQSEWIVLKSAEQSKQVRLEVPLAAAIRGVVVSEDGDMVKLKPYLDYGSKAERRHYVGTANGPWGPNDGRFGFYGLGKEPFRVRVYGWEIEPADEIQLEPGELRFLRVVLKKRSASNQP